MRSAVAAIVALSIGLGVSSCSTPNASGPSASDKSACDSLNKVAFFAVIKGVPTPTLPFKTVSPASVGRALTHASDEALVRYGRELADVRSSSRTLFNAANGAKDRCKQLGV
jgi:hypothetical protein